ncbi:MAG: hypothetical protein QW429_06115 [Thermoprotei archaeon]
MLPKESIIVFVEWDPTVEPELLVVRWENGVELVKTFDVDKSVLSSAEHSRNQLTVERDQLMLPGFAGFEARYTKLPDSELELRFEFELHFVDGCVVNKSATTRVVRPILEVADNPNEITVESSIHESKPIILHLANKGSADIRRNEAKLSLEIYSNKPLKAEVVTVSGADTPKPLFHDAKSLNHYGVKLSGLGHAELTITYWYSDALGNPYSGKCVIRLYVKSRVKKEIPLYNKIASSNLPAIVTEV